MFNYKGWFVASLSYAMRRQRISFLTPRYTQFLDSPPLTERQIVAIEEKRLFQVRRRIKRYVKGMLLTFPRLMLVSLTFNDTLYSTSASTRKQYVSRYLNSVFADYYACIDFGDLNGREHYHAIAAPYYSVEYIGTYKGRQCYDFVDVSKRWNHGWSSLIYIDIFPGDINRTLKYTMKSTIYASKGQDCENRPFHKRGVHHNKKESDYLCLLDDSFL